MSGHSARNAHITLSYFIDSYLQTRKKRKRNREKQREMPVATMIRDQE